MNEPPVDTLELRALEQRNRLHDSIGELNTAVREKLDFKENVRKHFVFATGVVSALGLLVGYSLGGMFTRH
jgi:hypothetical protein